MAVASALSTPGSGGLGTRVPLAGVGSSPAGMGPGAVAEGWGKWYGEDPLQALTPSGFFLLLC